MKATIYRSYCSWPIQWFRFRDGWLIRFFSLTIIVDHSHGWLVARTRRLAQLKKAPRAEEP